MTDRSGTSPVSADLLVVGGGMVGMTLALALARAGLEVIVVDRAGLEQLRDDSLDGRASAIAQGSRRILEAIGLWRQLGSAAQPILDIRVSDGRPGQPASGLFLHYDHQEVGDDPLGYLVENRLTRRALLSAAEGCPRLTLLGGRSLTGIERQDARVVAGTDHGERVVARLVVAADGRRSALRAGAGIGVTSWDYPQTGLVCTLHHELPHHGVAHENFLPSGPFAMLPLVDDAAGRHRSSIVWTERRDLAPAMLALDEDGFAREAERRFGSSLGKLEVLGQRWSYPLALSHAERYHDHRLVLVGDAAHAIHPIAGQGLNLGLRDVAALGEVIVDAWRLGLDIGSTAVLGRYQRWRRLDSLLLIAATDGLNRLFSNRSSVLRAARDLGLGLVERTPPLKRLFMRHAMGLVGDLPRLARGEAL